MKRKNKLSSAIIAVTRSKWTRSALIVLVLGIAAVGVTGCSKAAPTESGAHVQQYTCPMHPEVVQDAPGNCPKCGMKLGEKK